MDPLKEFIQQHREEFENDLPPKGHLERFEQRLDAYNRAKSTPSASSKDEGKRAFLRPVLLFLAATAACIGLLYLSIPIERTDSACTSPEAQEIAEINREFEEIPMYYNMQMTDIAQEMEKLCQENDTEAMRELMEQSQEIFRGNRHFEEEIIPRLPVSGQGLQTVNQYYQCSVGSLNQMLQYMKSAREQEATHKSKNSQTKTNAL